MKIQTGVVLKNLKGDSIEIGKEGSGEYLTLGRAIAEAVLSDQTGGKMKLYALADKCYNAQEVDVDISDLALIKQSLEKYQGYNALITGQALIFLEESK